ncbi:MAG: hypothetical protein ACKO96_36050, partial [Flammeovirgaceae bacterium]
QNSTKSTHVDFVQQSPTKSTVNDNVNVTVNVSTKVDDIYSRKLKFASTLKEFIPEFGESLINEFCEYWTEPNKSGTKFRQELQKTWDTKRRLSTWAKNDKNFDKLKNLNYGNQEQLSEIGAAIRKSDPTI